MPEFNNGFTKIDLKEQFNSSDYNKSVFENQDDSYKIFFESAISEFEKEEIREMIEKLKSFNMNDYPELTEFFEVNKGQRYRLIIIEKCGKKRQFRKRKF